jgi:hypothetical protein
MYIPPEMWRPWLDAIIDGTTGHGRRYAGIPGALLLSDSVGKWSAFALIVMAKRIYPRSGGPRRPFNQITGVCSEFLR